MKFVNAPLPAPSPISASALAATTTAAEAAAGAAFTRLQFRVPFGGYFWGKVANATPPRARKIPSKT